MECRCSSRRCWGVDSRSRTSHKLVLLPFHFHLHLFILLLLLIPAPPAAASASGSATTDDAGSLLSLRSALDPNKQSSPLKQWAQQQDACTWNGVRECMKGRVTKLVVENFNLTGGILDTTSLNKLDQIRVLSFKGNNLSGPIPNLSGLVNLKSLYLNQNSFYGPFPTSITGLHRLKIIVLSGNRLTGRIPVSLIKLFRLYELYLDDNQFSGHIPPLNNPGLTLFNVSNNRLSGKIPTTPALIRFNASSFSNNIDLCGVQISKSSPGHHPCMASSTSPPTMSPAFPIMPPPSKNGSKSPPVKLIAGVSAASASAAIIILVLLIVAVMHTKGRSKKVTVAEAGAGTASADKRKRGEEYGVGGNGRASVTERGEGSGYGGSGNGKGKGFSWEGEGLGSLIFLGDQKYLVRYSLEDLLKASAETLGRGTIGSTYKAVMESGFIVTVKRLKDARYPKVEEFRRQMEVLGRLNHPNVVPLRAYFQAKEERLLVFDYFPNGSLFSLIHGSRPSGCGKPLHWTSCLKIAEDLATGLAYIHQFQNLGLVHGNLKSSNVLLGSDFESCLTDYGLYSFRNNPVDHTAISEEPSATSLFYRAPECRDTRKPPTQQADLYSFGVLILELLTGKTPFQDLVQEHGSDIPKWVKSVREEETESSEDPYSGNESSASEEKLGALLNIAMACVTVSPENRPTIKEILKMIRDARAEAQISSNNSSDHSPGRWSDTIQSLPREEHLSI